MAASSGWMTSAASANRHIVVADSSHYIQLERPHVVVDAIEQVGDAVRNLESPRRSFTALHASQRFSGNSVDNHARTYAQLVHRHRYGLPRVPEECQVAEPAPGRQPSHIASFSVSQARECRVV